MKTAAWFIVSELLLVLTIVLIFSNWQGSVNFTYAWPLSGSALSITGAEHGGRVLLAFCTAILTLATFVVGIIRLFKPSGKSSSFPAATKTSATASQAPSSK
jgi:hypothetical protein